MSKKKVNNDLAAKPAFILARWKEIYRKEVTHAVEWKCWSCNCRQTSWSHVLPDIKECLACSHSNYLTTVVKPGTKVLQNIEKVTEDEVG